MRKSRSDTAQTRERIVSTAAKMFLEKGLAEAGMRDIMAAANLTPGGFYRHFESKEQLVAEANEGAFDRLLAMLKTQPLDKIIALYLGQSQREGNGYLCPLAMLGAELSHCDLQVRTVASNGHQRLLQLLADRLTHLSRAEALTIASAIVSTMVGAVMLANITLDKAAASAILSNAHAMISARLIPAGSRRRTHAQR